MKNRLREDLSESLGALEEEALSLIDKDIDTNPEGILLVTNELWDKVKELTQGVEVDLDASLTDGQGTAFNPFTQLEGFERVSMLISIIDDRFGFIGFDEQGNLEYDPEEIHPSLYDDYAKKLMADATEALGELYQHIGRWEILNKAEKPVDTEQ